MEHKYSKDLIKSNILLGIHSLLKGILILLLFIILYSIIWIKEKYLNYIKISVYIQLLIFLFLIIVILITNNPRFFDVCLHCILYIFIILSVFQISIIILESLGLITNFKKFINFFHECPYYRDYNDVIESKYQRSCLYYNEDSYSNVPYKYICFYNSEEEYFNKFCDGLLCKKYNFYDNDNDYVKCSGININSINFPENNIYFHKEKHLFDKKKNKKIYLCSRKKRVDIIKPDSDIVNSKYDLQSIECPDNNPIKKYIVFIYIELILHMSADLLFIIEFFILKNLNKIYFEINVINNQVVIPSSALSTQRNIVNRMNVSSINRVIVNIDRNKKNNFNGINSENDEVRKNEKNMENNNDEPEFTNNNERHEDEENIYTHKRKLNVIDNGYVDILNNNKNIKISRNTNMLLNAIKSPKIKTIYRNSNLNFNQSDENEIKTTENEENTIIIKKNIDLKNSQLQHLINDNNDADENEEQFSTSNEKDSNTNIKQEDKNNEINDNNQKYILNLNKNNNKKKNIEDKQVKLNKSYNSKNLININDQDNKNEIIKNNNNKENINNNKNSLKKFVQNKNQIYGTKKHKQYDFSIDRKKNKIENNKNNNKDENINKKIKDNKNTKKTLIDYMHIKSEFFLNDDELDNKEKEKEYEKNNKKIN